MGLIGSSGMKKTLLRKTALVFMKNLRNTSFTSVLFVIVLALLMINTVCAEELTATITSGTTAEGHYGVAYDSGKGKIFITNVDFNTVTVISESSSTSASPSTSPSQQPPSYLCAGLLIAIVAIVILVVVVAALLRRRMGRNST
jgi:hypothetical protein